MSELVCNHCKSDLIRKVSVIFEEGTSSGSGTSFGSAGGKLAVLQTATSSQSLLAKRLAPPPRMGFGKILNLVVLGVICLLVAVNSSGFFSAMFFTLLLVIVGAFFYGMQLNAAFPAANAIWLKKWHCNKCGEISIIE